ncbi:MAG TPA: proton-translocating transhydrogenase family protein [Rhizomicrobium sp.]|nr:proton-translocating transhydrogenase family protein [Rhizomicrobium sp.]
MEAVDPFVFRFSIFVLAIFVGYYVVWSVTPALHTPLMSVTNAISSVIVVGALIAVAVPAHVASGVYHEVFAPTAQQLTAMDANGLVRTAAGASATNAWISKGLGFFALILASVNIFGGFLVTSRMLAMYKKKEKK